MVLLRKKSGRKEVKKSRFALESLPDNMPLKEIEDESNLRLGKTLNIKSPSELENNPPA